MYKFPYIAAFFILLFSAQALEAKPIVADLAVRAIEIDHDFAGIEILLFGARNDVGDIVVVVRGPKNPYIVRKKERVAGIWVNRQSAEFEDIDGFYSIAATRPLAELNNDYLLSALDIGMENIELTPRINIKSIEEFKSALIRNKQEKSLYSKELEKVDFWGETLFRTGLKFPKNIMQGFYTAEVYLFSDGQLTGLQSTPIKVSKTGFEAFMYEAAHKNSLVYGLAAIFIALTAGWLASILFRRF